MRTRFFLLVVLLFVLPVTAQNLTEGPLTPQQKPTRALTNEFIIKMAKVGLDDSIILQTIRTSPGNYATGPDDLIALKQAGVSQQVISAMLAHNSGMQTHGETPTLVSTTPVSPNVDDIGVYYKMVDSHSDWEPLPLELVNYREGGAAKSIFTHNIIKKDMNGTVAGPSAKLLLKPGDHLLIYAPNGVQAEEYILIKFQQKGNRREFRTETGNVFHKTTGADRDSVEFTATKVATHMFQIDLPSDLKPGEYGVLPPGNANVRGMANAGKMYTFAIAK